MPVRHFIALELDAATRAALRQLQQRLVEAPGSGLRASAPQSLHVTVAFLGDLEQREASEAAAVMARCFVDVPPYRLECRALDVFGGARALALLVGGHDRQRLADDRAHLVSGLQRCELMPADARPFRPHLTIARSRSRMLRSQLAATVVEPLTFTVAAVSLVASVARDGAHEHTRIATVRLH